MRLPLALAALLALPLTPSFASDPLPVCVATLTHVASGTTGGCATAGPGPTGNATGGFYRTALITVAEGGVDVTLACDGRPAVSTHVPAGGAGTLGTWNTDACSLSLVATATSTTAVAASIVTWVENG